ncbi:MAG: hypothetical protein NTW78_08255 [Campylobacterales bacterium]|nr:hypothetical protein [Campylobacterales bacterium]
MSEVALNYVILFALFELYEASWQKAGSIIGMLARMYEHYSKSIFIFLLMHPTFYFSIWLVMSSDYNIYAMILLFVKTVDLATKIILIEQVFIKKELTEEISLILLSPINDLLPYIGLLLYLPLVVLAII